MIDQQKAARRVKLANILKRSGYDGAKILALIGMPYCTGMALNGLDTGGSFGNRPDDDFRITVEAGADGSTPAIALLADGQRNLGQYDAFTFSWYDASSHGHDERNLLMLGRILRVDTFDGWGNSWQCAPWEIQFVYSDDSTRTVAGGNDQGGDSATPAPDPIPSDYFTTGPHFSDYYENGHAAVPPPAPWPWPEWLRPEEEYSTGTAAKIS